MKPRLSRPLLAALVSGALVAGGAIYTSPASAGTQLAANPAADPSGDPSASVAPPSGDPSASVAPPSASVAPPSGDPSASVAPPSGNPSASVAPPSASVAPPSGNPSTPDTVKPTGSFKLSPSSLWVGQTVTFTQTAVADNSGAANLTRTISWGDGQKTTLAAGVNTAKHVYTTAKKYTVTEELVDKAKNKATLTGTVTVTVPGKFSLSKSTVYQGAPFNVNISQVPSGTTNIRIDWGDGQFSNHKPKNQSVSGYILYLEGDAAKGKVSGKRNVRVRLYNKNGASSYIKAGTINVLSDNSRPSLKITKPSNANKVSSWKTVRGTVSDKQSGLWQVGVTAVRVTTTGKTYCMTSKTKWKRYTTESQFAKYCKFFQVKASKGKWSLKLPSGLTKGYVIVSAFAVDNADNGTVKTRQAKLTRS